MLGRLSPQDAVDKAQIAVLVKRLIDIPDKLVTAQLYLHPLSQSDPVTISVEARQTIADACDLLHSALVDIVDVARNLTTLSAPDDNRPTSRRVGADSYYGPAP
jgi:hypothetical protein